MMMEEIIKKIDNDEHCQLLEKRSDLNLPDSYHIPEDMKLYYSYCGGANLFHNKDYQWNILSPNDINNACETVINEPCEATELEYFFCIAEDGNGDYLAINLGKENNGVIVDAFHETFGLAGDTPVIALSFTELLNSLYDNSGDYPYWLGNKERIYRDWFV